MNTKTLLVIITLLLCCSCSQSKSEQVGVNVDIQVAHAQSEAPISQEETDDEIEAMLDSIIDSSNDKSLNDIRFGNWTEKDWYDNGYFRFLRKCMDDCLQGIENENTRQLQDYKSAIKDKFFIYDAEPFIGGGLFVTFGFLNNPEVLYQTVVYSDVDEDTEAVVGYSLRSVKRLEETIDLTKEDIQQAMKEMPEFKLW